LKTSNKKCHIEGNAKLADMLHSQTVYHDIGSRYFAEKYAVCFFSNWQK